MAGICRIATLMPIPASLLCSLSESKPRFAGVSAQHRGRGPTFSQRRQSSGAGTPQGVPPDLARGGTQRGQRLGTCAAAGLPCSRRDGYPWDGDPLHTGRAVRAGSFRPPSGRLRLGHLLVGAPHGAAPSLAEAPATNSVPLAAVCPVLPGALFGKWCPAFRYI